MRTSPKIKPGPENVLRTKRPVSTTVIGTVKKCDKYQQAAKFPARQRPVRWLKTKRPWKRIHVNFNGPIENWTYMTIMGAHSKWQKVFPSRRPTTTSIMAALEKVFSTHWILETLVSGNYSQFNSGKFSEFWTRRSIEHVRTPPYHLQSMDRMNTWWTHSNWNYSKERAKPIVQRLIKTSGGGGQVKQKKRLFLLPDTCNLSYHFPPRIKRAYEPTVPRRSTRTRHDRDPPAKSNVVCH